MKKILMMAAVAMMTAVSGIAFDTGTRQPRIVGTKCVGCHLCRLVCPTGAIGVTKRIKKK